MGNDLFGIDIAGIVFDNFDGQLFDVLIERYARGEREANNLTGGRAVTPSTFAAQGFWEDFTSTPPGVEIELNDRKAVLIGDSIESGGIPERLDAITIEGQTLYVERQLSRDPAAATYVFHCKDRRGPDGA